MHLRLFLAILAAAPLLAGCLRLENECTAPKTCASASRACGPLDDGCGHVLDCGTCAAGLICGGGGVDGVCGRPACTPSTCAELGLACGTAGDGCGGVLECGGCGAGEACGAGGTPNQCATTCAPQTCAALQASCGSLDDGCGGTLQCGGCPSGSSCDASHTCVCVPKTCLVNNQSACGDLFDGCGGTLHCGGCPSGYSCGADNTCACTSSTCSGAPQLEAWLDEDSSGGYFINLGWTFMPGVQLERSIDGVSFQTYFDSGSQPSAGFGDFSVGRGQPYWYRVRAVNNGVAGPYSNVVEVIYPGPQRGSFWSTLGGVPEHTGEDVFDTGTPPLTEAWSVALDGGAVGPVVCDGLRIFASTASGQQLWAFDATLGTPVWSHDFGAGARLGMPAVFYARVALAAVDATGAASCVALDAASGGVLWSNPLASAPAMFWPPTLDSYIVYLPDGSGGLYGFDAQGPAAFHSGAYGAFDAWTPADHLGVYYTFVAGSLAAHSYSDTASTWVTSVPFVDAGPDLQTAPVYTDSAIFVLAPPTLTAISPTSEQVLWSAQGQHFSGLPAASQGYVYALSQGTLAALDASTGNLAWTFAGDGALAYPPVVAAGYVYVSSATTTWAVSTATQAAVWSAPVGGWLSVANGMLYVGGTDGVLHAFALTQ